MAKYKHKKSGKIVESDDLRYNKNNHYFKLFTNEHRTEFYAIPKEFVLESNEWEEIKEPILKTEKGTEKFPGDTCWYTNPHFEVRQWSNMRGSKQNWKGYYYFDTEDEAYAFANVHKAEYSLKDITIAFAEGGYPFAMSDFITSLLYKTKH